MLRRQRDYPKTIPKKKAKNTGKKKRLQKFLKSKKLQKNKLVFSFSKEKYSSIRRLLSIYNFARCNLVILSNRPYF